MQGTAILIDKETISNKVSLSTRRPALVSDLTAHLGYWLRYVSNHVSHAFAQKVSAKGVTVAEWVLMRSLYDSEPTPPSVLAGRMGMTRGAITKLADRLLAKGLLVRNADPDDRRAQKLALTAAGLAIVPELAALADQNDAEFFDHLGQPERQAIERILKEIVSRRDLKTIPVE